MKMVVFGLAISSSWGNGHATLWRCLQRALARRGWQFVFFERETSWYAGARDLTEIPGGELVLYGDWAEAAIKARRHLAAADVGIVTSFCPDGVAATEELLGSPCPLRLFYDLDTPVTLSAVGRGEAVSAIGPRGLADFDLVLSFTGGEALQALEARLGARRAVPLYGHVDPEVYRPAAPDPSFAADLSYLGTYAADRQPALEALLIEPARRRPGLRFAIGGAQYPEAFPWTPNIFFVRHLTADQHPAFYASSRLTLNVTRGTMAAMGWCPSGRLFEAAACGAAILSDRWPGLDSFFAPGEEILIAAGAADTMAALDRSDAELRRVGKAARERVLADHTSDHRAGELERILEQARLVATPRYEEA